MTAEWTTNDKLQQYRGVLRLNARHKKSPTLLKQSRQISKLLLEDINEYRIIIDGDRKHLITLFQGHKDLLLTLINSSPSEILLYILEDNCLKQKQLDKLCCQKKQKMKKVFELKVESTIVSSKIYQEKKQVSDKILTRCQRSLARHNAAQSIGTTYESMLKILEKDAIYYDTVSKTMIKNQKEQSKLILNTTLMGQIAAENLDTNRQKYNNLAHEILMNTIERERTLKIARVQVEFAQSLIQNDTVEKLKESYNEELEKQVKTLEQVFVQVKQSFHEQSVELLLSRLEEQLTKKKKLFHHLKHVIKENDLLLKKKHHAQLILDAFQHTMISSVEQYNLRRIEMLEKIKMKNKFQRNLIIFTKVQEKLLMKMKGALQSIRDFIMDIKSLEADEKEETADIDDVIDQVIQNVTLLLSNLKFDERRDFHKKYKLKYNKDESADIFEDEYEIIDSNILTRKDIKKQSKQILETRLV